MNRKYEYNKNNDRISPSLFKKMLIGGAAVVATIGGVKYSENHNNEPSSEITRQATITFDSGSSYNGLAKEMALADGITSTTNGYQSTIDNLASVAEALNNSAEITPQTVLENVPITVDRGHANTTTMVGNGVNITFNLPK